MEDRGRNWKTDQDHRKTEEEREEQRIIGRDRKTETDRGTQRGKQRNTRNTK